MKNWYGIQIACEDGWEIFADSEDQVFKYLTDQGYQPCDIDIEYIGTADPNHWENEHITCL